MKAQPRTASLRKKRKEMPVKKKTKRNKVTMTMKQRKKMTVKKKEEHAKEYKMMTKKRSSQTANNVRKQQKKTMEVEEGRRSRNGKRPKKDNESTRQSLAYAVPVLHPLHSPGCFFCQMASQST